VATLAYERQPGFVACYAVALVGHLLGSLLVALALIPVALVMSTGVALSAEPSRPTLGLLLPWLLALAAQPLVAAWIACSILALFDAGRVTYLRASGAMALALLGSFFFALVLPDEAALPLVGYAWTGAALAAVIMVAQPARATS
jgi:hypothetical protein